MCLTAALILESLRTGMNNDISPAVLIGAKNTKLLDLLTRC